MAAPGWIELFVERFEALGVPYMVTGSVASMVYGEPRLTLDVDVVLALDAAGGPRSCSPVALGEGELALAPPEYVIVRKLEWWREGGSEKHLRDVRAMLGAGPALDRAFLEAELRRRGLAEAWRRVADSG